MHKNAHLTHSILNVNFWPKEKGGDHKRSEYVQYVPVILADVPARTTFIDIPRSVLVHAHA